MKVKLLLIIITQFLSLANNANAGLQENRMSNCFKNSPLDDLNVSSKHFVIYELNQLSAALLTTKIKQEANEDLNLNPENSVRVKKVCFSNEEQKISFMVEWPTSKKNIFGQKVFDKKIYTLHFKLESSESPHALLKMLKMNEVKEKMESDSSILVVGDEWINADNLPQWKSSAEIKDEIQNTASFITGFPSVRSH